MIIVVEGISASGKTAWCAQHAADHFVPEISRFTKPPDKERDPTAAALFWSEQNAQRWQAAIEMEGNTGFAICDTDPLKLHYVWCLWQVGEAPEHQWQCELEMTRRTISEGRLGFGDTYFIKKIDPHTARLQRDGDATRSRHNFELHLRLQPALIVWYEALGAALPGRVQFDLPAQPMISVGQTGVRYDVALFDQAMSLLPNMRAS